MYKVLEPLIKQMGFCCLYGFIRQTRKVTSFLISEKLGVSSRTVDYNRKKVDYGWEVCKDCRGCLKKGGEQPKVDFK